MPRTETFKAYAVTVTLVVNVRADLEGEALVSALHETFKDRCALGESDDIDRFEHLDPDPNEKD